MSSPCQCSHLTYEPSTYAREAGYKRCTGKQRVEAAGQKAGNVVPDSSAFPAPLVLPDDDLAWDPDYPAQDVAEWEQEEDRNPVTKRRNVIYIAPPPTIGVEAKFMSAWSKPTGQKSSDKVEPATQNIADYISAFYHGMSVKVLPETFSYTIWEESTKAGTAKGKSRAKQTAKTPQHIGLNNGKECVRISVRPPKDGVFAQQLNLNDVIDAIISMMPKDAYAVMLLLDHDMYESEEDDYCCGRAYGGSRAGVVSMARYNPFMDEDSKCEREHAWPASHCDKYVREFVEQNAERPIKKSKQQKAKQSTAKIQTPSKGPVMEAVKVYKRLAGLDVDSLPVESQRNVWLARMCRTVSHELGHCFGIDHCVYYACAMQGTASIAEDVRQPPYLCPVDIEKVLRATGTTMETRYKALRVFCHEHGDVSLFAAFGAWITGRLAQMEANDTGKKKDVIVISP